MSDEMKQQIKAVKKTLEALDTKDLMILASGAQMLKARHDMDLAEAVEKK